MSPPPKEGENDDVHLQSSIAMLTERLSALQREVSAHDQKDTDTQALIFEKLDSIFRLIWIAFGGVIVIGGVIALIGGNILKLLGR